MRSDELAARFGGQLVAVRSPLEACGEGGEADCAAALANLRNPFFIEDEPGGYHTTGWHGAYETGPSPYAVAVETAEDIAAVVRFARERGIRLAIKGTGHDYLGRSCAPDSLLVWTHAMRKITVHPAFTPAGAPPDAERGIPAVTVGAGTRWLEVYQAVAEHGRLVQGGGCTTVGAAGGFTQGGGFGSFSRRYGTAAGNVLEFEVVTAAGEVVVANAHQRPDLFYALRGGGGGTFGVVSKVTFRTHPMPATVSAVTGTIRASSAPDYRRLLRAVVSLFADFDSHWGEQIHFWPDDTVRVSMCAVDLDDRDVGAAWRPLLDWVARQPDAYAAGTSVVTVPFAGLWDDRWQDERVPESIRHDDRPGAEARHFWWATNQNEVSWHLDSYQSRWVPAGLFENSPDALADALFTASRIWPLQLVANKGLAAAPPEVLAREQTTSINPAAFDAAALVISASAQQSVFPGVPGHEPDAALGAARARRVAEAMDVIRAITPDSGSYVNETDYFELDWQRSFWGANYPKLLEVKRRYDPDNVFRVHHGVGSE